MRNRIKIGGFGVIGATWVLAGMLPGNHAGLNADETNSFDRNSAIAAIEKYLDDTSFGLVALPIDSRGFSGVQRVVSAWRGSNVEGFESVRYLWNQGVSLAAAVEAAGGRYVCFIGNTADGLLPECPLMVIVCEPEHSQAVATAVDAFVRQEVPPTKSPAFAPATSVVNDHVVLIGDRQALKRTWDIVGSKRRDLLEPWRRLDDGRALLVAVVSPSHDQRRALLELLPAALPDMDSGLLRRHVEGVRFITVVVRRPVDWSVEIVAECDGDETCQLLKQSLNQLVPWLVKRFADGRVDVSERTSTGKPPLQPRIEGNRVIVSIGSTTAGIDAFMTKEVLPNWARLQFERNKRQAIRRMREVILACANFESGTKAQPAAAAFRDKDGTPLLSWRVAVLPFLDEIELYEQFHLDEPWDSEHNLAVARRMPAVFQHPNEPELNRRGMTTYVVPVAPWTLFPPADQASTRPGNAWDKPTVHRGNGLKHEDMDDPDATVVLAELAPRHAVFWTKPADWDVESDQPFEQLRVSSDGLVRLGYANGSVQSHFVDKLSIDMLHRDRNVAAK